MFFNYVFFKKLFQLFFFFLILIFQSNSFAEQTSSSDCYISTSNEAFNLIENGCLRGANIYQGREYATVGDIWFPNVTQKDMDDLRANHANYVNLSVPGPYGISPPYDGIEEYFDKLDELIQMAEQADLFVILSFRTAPGRSETNITDEKGIKTTAKLLKQGNKVTKDAFVDMWLEVAKEYSHYKHVVGYDLLVEPHGNNNGNNREIVRITWRRLAQRTIDAIRSVDKQTPILISPDDWGVASSLAGWKPLVGSKLIYTVHQYEPYESFTHANHNIKGFVWQEPLDNAYKEISNWISKNNIPIIVNEYGLQIINNDNGGNTHIHKAPGFMRQQIEKLETNQLSHAAWLWEVENDPEYTYQEFDFKENKATFDSIKKSWRKNVIFPSMIN
jgi:hypothetical protein